MSRRVGSGLLLAALAACGGSGGGDGGEPPRTWTPAGGSATVALNDAAPFMQFAPGIDASEMAGVSQGRELFVAEWQPAPGPRTLIDGLGPLFNANACTSCHVADGRVPPLAEGGATTPGVLFRIGNAEGQVHPLYGGQLQDQATAGLAEGRVNWSQEAAAGALTYTATLFGEVGLEGFHLGPRIAPQLLGMGLLDRVSEDHILAGADPDDRDGDGVSGRVHWVNEDGATRVGRFGWKAINASLRTQNAGALHQDMGLTSPVRPAENCTALQTVCAEQPGGGSPEVSEASLSAIVDFMTVLAVPERRIAERAAFDRGAALFERVGCAACHRPTLLTGGGARFPGLSGQTVYAYTDLLLHDMGEALGDGVKEGDAQPAEWRTPPLWGIGLVERKPGARFLHDGRAASLREAIGWHGGEALGARTRFQALGDADQALLLQFLRGI
ncbi:di-heme oxidoredictase family protein [Piscinibacter sp.]|uniref:di-heme oxidoredictase family protein n=1 Tax=Piscinibacter sp. TaxID=1903157 RepID=UPI0039E4DF85